MDMANSWAARRHWRTANNGATGMKRQPARRELAFRKWRQFPNFMPGQHRRGNDQRA
jgi:hypothetical protein